MRRSTTLLAGLALAVLADVACADDAQVVRDPQGRVIQRVGEDGRVVWYRYDAAGRLVEERRSDGRRTRTVSDDARSTPETSAR